MMTLLYCIYLLSSAFSFETEFSLRLGAHTSLMNINSFNELEDDFWGGGFNSNISWRFTSSEWGLASFAFFGGGKTNLGAGTTQVVGRSKIRRVAIGPFYKFITPFKSGYWNLYLSTGPVWSMETFKFSSPNVTSGTFPEGYKISLVSRGAFISLGMEKNLKSKKNKPMFWEIRYGFSEAQRAYLVNASDYKSVITLSEEKNRKHVKIHTLAINIGILLF
ncbi:MAG: hypothetical protein OXB84_01925 [Halobacteriovoraceae bacterium]|nr:hypothetical protein [Halobacteriovoraceae bacterium]